MGLQSSTYFVKYAALFLYTASLTDSNLVTESARKCPERIPVQLPDQIQGLKHLKTFVRSYVFVV